MQSFNRHALRKTLAVSVSGRFSAVPVRKISLTGAIEKGNRDWQHSAGKHDARHGASGSRHLPPDPRSRDSFDARGPPGKDTDRVNGQLQNQARYPEPRKIHETIPRIPYTTASSVFVYGTFSVLAALKAKRRKLYKLYRYRSPSENEELHQPGRRGNHRDQKDSNDYDRIDKDIYTLARGASVEVKDVWGPQWNQALSRVTGGRPHNGLVLEASPLPQLPVTTLSGLKQSSDDIVVTVGPASQEDREVNSVFDTHGSVATIPSVRPNHRYPFMLMLDRITDTGNFGAIARSAWFLGVDAILLLEHGTAPVSANALKASAGALEYMPILHVKNERAFVKDSRQNGWKFFAADAPDCTHGSRPQSFSHNGQRLEVEGALLKHPCVLVLGNEGTGIRDFMRTLMDGLAGIPNARPGVGDIDSLNVSVASALMTQKFFDSAPDPQSGGHAEVIF